MRKFVQTALTATAILIVTAAMGIWGPPQAQAQGSKSQDLWIGVSRDQLLTS